MRIHTRRIHLQPEILDVVPKPTAGFGRLDIWEVWTRMRKWISSLKVSRFQLWRFWIVSESDIYLTITKKVQWFGDAGGQWPAVDEPLRSCPAAPSCTALKLARSRDRKFWGMFNTFICTVNCYWCFVQASTWFSLRPLSPSLNLLPSIYCMIYIQRAIWTVLNHACSQFKLSIHCGGFKHGVYI